MLTWQDFVAYTEFNRRLLNHVKSEMAAGHTWLEARKSLVLPDGYHWERLDGTIQDLYKGLTPWWRFW